MSLSAPATLGSTMTWPSTIGSAVYSPTIMSPQKTPISRCWTAPIPALSHLAGKGIRIDILMNP
jgi:hypothetical protein